MSCFLRKRRSVVSGPADPTTARAAVGRMRKAKRSPRAGKKVGLRRCRKVESEEAAVAERLEVLKGLMPSTRCSSGCGEEEERVGVERLFEEAAWYVILLKTRVGVLQKLLDVYGATGEERSHAAVSYDEHPSE